MWCACVRVWGVKDHKEFRNKCEKINNKEGKRCLSESA